MDLRVLEYFLMVAREENITRAAQLIHISQPTLSRQLSGLEEELGVKLFVRSKHSIRLTGEGLMFRRRAQEIIDLTQKAKGELQQEDEELSGEISIGAGELKSLDELGELINEFQKIYPKVKFNIKSEVNVDIKAELEQGLIDFGILLEPIDLAKYDFVRLKTHEQWGVLVSESSVLASKEYLAPSDLINIPLMITDDSNVRSDLSNWFGDLHSCLNVIGKYSLIYNATAIARKCGNAVVCLNLNCDYDGLKFVPLKDKTELTSVIVWKNRQVLSRILKAFIDFSRNAKSE